MTHFLWIGRGCVLLARAFLAGGRLNLRQQRFPLSGYSGIRQSSVSTGNPPRPQWSSHPAAPGFLAGCAVVETIGFPHYLETYLPESTLFVNWKQGFGGPCEG